MRASGHQITSPKKGMESFISSGDTLCDVIKAGPLKKVRTNKKKYFVVRRGSGLGPARIEYYDSEKRFSKPGAVPKRIIKIRDCWNISSRKDTKGKLSILIHTREDSLALVAEESEHESWLNELKDLHDAEFAKAPGITPKYDHMWNAQIKPTALGAEGRYGGKYRLCLSPTHLYLVRLDFDQPDLSFPLSTIRRCGHNECHFVMAVGRSAPTGEGEFAMQVEDSAMSQDMHGVILAAMKANKSTESSSARNRPRSHQYKKSGGATPYRASLAGTAADLAPMMRPRTMSESTKVCSYASPHRRSPKTLDRRAMSVVGRTSVVASSTASSPFSSSSSIDHGFRNRSDSSGSRATTTSEEDGVSRHSIDQSGADGMDYLSMTCGATLDQGRVSGGEEENYMAMETTSKHSSQSLEVVNEDSGYMEMVSGSSTTSSKQDAASSSRRPSLVSPGDDDYCLHTPLEGADYLLHAPLEGADYLLHTPLEGADYLLHAPADSPDHTTPVNDRSDYAIHGGPRDRSDYVIYGGPRDRSDYAIHGGAPRHGDCDSCDGQENDYTIMSPVASSRSPVVSIPSSGSGGGGGHSDYGDYMPMGPCHSLPTVQERSGDNRILMEANPGRLGFGIIYPSDDGAPSPLNVQPDFPKRAYSVGSRPETLRPRNKVRTGESEENDAKSSSAPHLTVEQRRLHSPATSQASNYGSESPGSAGSRRGSRDDPELFMEVSFDRQRLGSDAFRPRTSSWGQTHRPRAHSHASKLKRGGDKTQVSHSRSSSHELMRKDARAGPGSSESLTKIHYVSPHHHHHDYMEISPLATERGAREIQDLANCVQEMTLQYSEITGPVGIVTRNCGRGTTLPRARASHHHHLHHVTSRPPPRPIKAEEVDTYVIGEPLNVRNGGNDVIPRMVDVWTPNIKPGDEDEGEYMCLNPAT